MDSTERLALPMLVPGQAQKELWHNEALLLLDAMVAGAVEDVPLNDAPPSPVAGECYIVGETPTGEWAQFPAHVAAFASGGWRFIAPVVGLSVFVRATGTFATYLPGGWDIGAIFASRLLVDGDQVVGPRAGAIADPSGGSTIDTQARTALAQILVALRSHGLIAE